MYGLNFGRPAIPEHILRTLGHRGAGPHRIRLRKCGQGRYHRPGPPPMETLCSQCDAPIALGDFAVLVGIAGSESERDRMVLTACNGKRCVHVLHVRGLYALYVS